MACGMTLRGADGGGKLKFLSKNLLLLLLLFLKNSF
jgi:hypothetical protein